MQIFVKLPSGRTITPEVEGTGTVEAECGGQRRHEYVTDGFEAVAVRFHSQSFPWGLKVKPPEFGRLPNKR